ncbi:MAG: SDR family NAD(P)-dependent oxidoreductase [Burkholderiaceae bacterium]|nr:SDR family NAD(P)-dependent oxidoreductase [Burkholderiaceae bacterium]
MISFPHRTVLITGACGGIGAATAEQFFSGGANVILTDLNEDSVKEAAKRLDPTEVRARGYKLNISDHDECRTVVADAARHFGQIDSLVNCAGIYIYREGLLSDLTQAQWRTMMSVNLDGCFNICQAVIPHLGDDSSIVLVSSVAAHRGSFMHSSYAAAKNGVIGLARSLALELAPRTRVNAISPGLINTPMTDAMVAHSGDVVKENIPLKRFGAPSEAAGVIVFLCSSLASYVSGDVIHVNGGMYIG